MDCAPNVNIFRELQTVHDTGYFSGHVSPEEDWQQVRSEAGKGEESKKLECIQDGLKGLPSPLHVSGHLDKSVFSALDKPYL